MWVDACDYKLHVCIYSCVRMCVVYICETHQLHHARPCPHPSRPHGDSASCSTRSREPTSSSRPTVSGTPSARTCVCLCVRARVRACVHVGALVRRGEFKADECGTPFCRTVTFLFSCVCVRLLVLLLIAIKIIIINISRPKT